MGPSQVGMPNFSSINVGRSWSSWKESNPPLLQPCKVGIHIWSLGPIRIFWKPKKPDGLDGKGPWDERVGFFGISGSEKKVLVFDESLQVYMILCRRNGGFQRFCTFQCDSIIVFLIYCSMTKSAETM